MHFNAFDYVPFGTATVWLLIVIAIDRARARRGDRSGDR